MRAWCVDARPKAENSFTGCVYPRSDLRNKQLNKPSAGARTVKELNVGVHPLQLYSMATPNGQKVTIALEEMGFKYDAWYTNIMSVRRHVLWIVPLFHVECCVLCVNRGNG